MKMKNVLILGFGSFLISLFTPTGEAHFLWEKIPVYNSLFGFVGAIALILISKFLGKHLIQKGEDYYG
jgi:hypothetical protein